MNDRKNTIGLVFDIDKGAHCESFDQTDTHAFLKRMYDLIGCDLITITWANINGIECEIVADDEGLLKSDSRISVLMGNDEDGYSPWLVRNIIIFGKGDDDGYHTSVTEEEASAICENIRKTSMFALFGNEDKFGKYVMLKENYLR